MSGKYIFDLRSEDRRRDLPRTLIVGQRENESTTHVLLKLLAYVLFYRERLQVGGNLHNDNIPFEPDLVQLDYTLRPVFWVECGDCGVNKLNKLAVKVPEAELWVLKPSFAEAEQLLKAVKKEELRKDRYQILGMEESTLTELVGLLQPRNAFLCVSVSFEPPSLQFDFNGLWFDTTFLHLKY